MLLCCFYLIVVVVCLFVFQIDHAVAMLLDQITTDINQRVSFLMAGVYLSRPTSQITTQIRAVPCEISEQLCEPWQA